MKSDALVKRFVVRYGPDSNYEALGAACRGATNGRYMNRLRVLLRQASIKNPEGFVALMIPQKDMFDIIFMFAENSSDGMGKQWSSFTQQVCIWLLGY